MTVGAIEPQFYTLFLKGLGFTENEIDKLPNQLDDSQWANMKDLFTSKFKNKTQKEWSEVRIYTYIE